MSSRRSRSTVAATPDWRRGWIFWSTLRARCIPSGIRELTGTTRTCSGAGSMRSGRHLSRPGPWGGRRRHAEQAAGGWLHRPPGHALQEFLQLLLPELRHAGGAVAAGVGARRNEVEAAVLHARERLLGDPGFRRIALVVRRVDRQQRRRDALEARGGVIVA